MLTHQEIFITISWRGCVFCKWGCPRKDRTSIWLHSTYSKI